MEYRYKQLEKELSALVTDFAQLSAHLAEVSKEITSPGVMPTEKLLERIEASRTRFDAVRSSVLVHAGAMLVSPLPKAAEMSAIPGIDILLKAAQAAEESKYFVEGERAKSLAVLVQALSIRHKDVSDFKPLVDCHVLLGQLHQALTSVVWPHRHPDSEAIVASKHAVCLLIELVLHREDLDDERWMVLEEAVSTAYSKPLFVAASRGKLVLA
ncbi:MAG: hypothetical protein ABIZ80_20290, partial [Bryobacteraceae bacterium]